MDVGVTTVVYRAAEVYSWLIIIRIILSYIRLNPYHPVVRFIYEITEPVLRYFRKIVPPMGIFDFSPLVALIAVQLLSYVIIRLLLFLGIY